MFGINLCSLAVSMVLASGPAAAPWTHPEAKYRVPVHLDTSQFTTDVDQFGLSIRLPADKVSPDGLAAGGVIVEDGMSGKVLDHRLELAPDRRGSTLLVTVPRLYSRSVDGLLWVYYGAPSVEDGRKGQLFSGPRSLDLRFVCDGSGALSVGNDGLKVRTEGKVDVVTDDGISAIKLDGDGIVSVDLPAELQARDTGWLTLEALAYDENTNASMSVGHGLVSVWSNDGKRDEPLINFGKVGFVMHSDARRGSDGQWVGATNFGKAQPGHWNHYAAVYDLNAGKVTTYLNGERAGEGTAPNQKLPMDSIHIGGWRPGAFAWQGRIAQVRVSTENRSQAWLSASAASMLPDGYLAIVGPEETQGAPTLAVSSQPPVCMGPNDGCVLKQSSVRLRWSMVPGADHYRVEVSRHRDMAKPLWEGTASGLPSIVVPVELPQDVPVYWRVSVPGGGWSAVSSFTISTPDQRVRAKDMAPLAPPSIQERHRLLPGDIDSFRTGGVVGERVNAALENWALRVPGDNPDLVGMFYKQWHADGFLDWWGESFGKFYQGASLLYRMTGDKRLRSLLDTEVSRALAAQEPSGYLGALLPERRLFGPGPSSSNWDLYNGHHTLMALLEYYEATHNEKALRSAMHMADLWCDVFGPGKRSIIQDIPGPDQCNLGVIAPLTWLYRLTGRDRYLGLARFVVSEVEAEYGPQWIKLAAEKKHCTEMKGTHALEQFFVMEGIMDLYFITGDTKLRDAMVHWYRDMTARERMAHGNLAPEELWHNDPHSASWAETCVATAYERFALQVFYAIAEPQCADAMEEVMLNAYFGAQRPDGSLWVYPVSVNGNKLYGWYTLKPEDPDLGCCFAYALTGMGLIPRWATMVTTGNDPALVVNYYGAGKSAAKVNRMRVTVEQETAYPMEPDVVMKVKPEKPGEFGVWLRIPAWSKKTTVSVNNEAPVAAAPGEYLKLHRRWKSGDTIRVSFDFTPRVVNGSGETEGRVAVYRGPLFLTADTRFNPDYDAAKTRLDLARFELKPHAGYVPGPKPWALFDAPTVGGGILTLCDFATAGALGERYEGWIPASGAK